MLVTANAASTLLKLASADYKTDTIDYKVKGKLSTRIGLLRSIPFEETGTLPISDLLRKKRKGG